MTSTFFSIKWKAALVFGSVLLIFNGLFPVMVYWNLQQNFEFSRKQLQEQFQQTLTGELQNTSNRLQRIAELSLIPENASSDKTLKALNSHQSKLELDWHIIQAQLFNASSIKLGGWGDELPSITLALIPQVLAAETASTLIDCSQGCKQYDFIPVLSETGTTLVLALAYDMSIALVDFANNTGADVAILTRQQDKTFSPERELKPWHMHVSALTSFQKNIAYLHDLSNILPLPVNIENHAIIRHKNLPIEFHLIPTESNNEVLFIIIDDIESQQQNIWAITLASIFLSLFGILILGAGLFLFIARPLSRLSNVSTALRALAKQRYADVRGLISPVASSHHNDELDQLELSTTELTTQLENLQQSVRERSESLQNRSLELKQERDFIKSLIDTAQLIIITTDSKLNITSFNDFAEKTTGYLEEDIVNTPFQRFFPAAQWSEMQAILHELKHTANSLNQQESEFIHYDGSIRIISWLHSSLEHPTDSSVVLSVGLDITDKKHSEQQIVWLAEHDSLTELFNRRNFNLAFEQLLHIAQRFNHKGMLLFLDLDQFKDINDSCGHKMGDQVLKKIGQLLSSITRNTDIVARIGGDEFAIILPEIDNLGAITLAKKISDELAVLDFIFNNTRFKVTASIGLIEFPLADLSIEELVANADLAMYQAKSRGKNSWHQFNLDDQTRTQLQTRVLWKQKIEEALENHRFVFYYQPIMEIHSQTVSHYEMLIRMQDEDGTIHSPATFIQVAENTGLIHRLDHYVLQQGIAKQAELDACGANISLSINLSGYAVDDTLLFPLLKRLLDETQANPEHLIFELTETAAVADIEQAKLLMLQLNALGCRFSLDDFGTGFASFHYMRELPVDIVKIDGSFIVHLTENTDDQLFVKALVDVAKGMGKKTIAEFVENAETLALLQTFGVDYAQGYYIGKPQPYFLDKPPVLK